MLPNPSYATDPQLRQMAQGGLPSAINEEITRLAMRRGARVNPQAQAAPPQRKMSPEEMIEDFVTRVRGKNSQASQSIVPAGTPMQQPQQPPQQAPQGIKAFATGGVNISYGRDPEKDARFQGRTASGYILPNPNAPAPAAPSAIPMVTYDPNGYAMRGEPRTAIPKGPLMPPKQNMPAFNQALQDAWGRTQASGGLEAAVGPDYVPGFEPPPGPQGVSAGAPGLPPEPSLGKLPDRINALPFEPGKDYIDPLSAADRAIEGGKDRIASARRPYDAAVREARGDLEENKRKSVFRAMIDAGVAAMQAGGPSRDPASGDFMSIAGASVGQYVASLDRDKEYQQRLKDKIASYNIAGSESELRVEDYFRQLGVQSAGQENNFNSNKAAMQNQYNLTSTGMLVDQRQQDMTYEAIGKQMAVQLRGQNIDAVLKQAALDQAATGGVDPKLSLEAATKAGDAALRAYELFLSNSGYKEESDEARRAAIMEQAQAQYVGVYAQQLQQNMSSLGMEFDFDQVLGRTQNNAKGIAQAADMEGAKGGAPATPKYSSPYAPTVSGQVIPGTKVY